MARGRKTGGRPPGSVNKTTADLKAMIEGALSEVGGQSYLVEQARKNPKVFLLLVSKLIPRDLHLSGEVKHTLEQLIVAGLQPKQADQTIQ